MEQLFEFAGDHPFLVSAALILTVLVFVNEMRLRTRGATALHPNEAIRLINQGSLVLDVRGAESYGAGHIINARNVPLAELQAGAGKLDKHKNRPVLVYCDNGINGGKAAAWLKSNSFAQVFALRGGLAAWRRDNLPVVKSGAAKKKH